MSNKLDAKRVALSIAIVSTIFYIVCALLIAVSPEFTMNLFSNVFHGIDIIKISNTSISLGSTLIGLVEIFVYALIAGLLFAWIYNKLGK